MLAIQSLMEKKGRFDQIVLETTGLADPAPIIQAFWNEEILALGLSKRLLSIFKTDNSLKISFWMRW